MWRLIALLLPLALGAAELSLAPAIPWFRPGAPVLLDLHWDDAAAADADRIVVMLQQGDETLADQTVPLDDAGSLRDGLSLPLFPGGGDPDRSAQVIAAVFDASNGMLTSAEATLAGRPIGAAGLAARSAELDPGPTDDLPRLWITELREHLDAGVSAHHYDAIAHRLARLEAWQAGERPQPQPGAALPLAVRDPVDDSLFPATLHLPSDLGALRALVLCSPASPDLRRRIDRPRLPAAWRAAADAADVAVLVSYPGGDAWQGRNLARLALARRAAEAALPQLAQQPLALLGVGNGAIAAIGFGERWPGVAQAIALVDPALGTAWVAPTVADPQRDWLATWQSVGRRPMHLAPLDCGLSGTADAAAQEWIAGYRAAGGVTAPHVGRPDQPLLWRWLAEQAATAAPPPSRLVAPRPGSYGPITVQALAEWGRSARLQRSAEGHWQGHGVASASAASEAVWQGPSQPLPAGAAKVLGRAQGPLATYAEAPFVVVVGTGESQAALDDNRATAAAFVAAWRRHSGSEPPVIDDRAIAADEQRNLVCIGSPASNSVLADLAGRRGWILPLRWDDRFIYHPGGDFPRQLPHAIAAIVPHPSDPQRSVVVLEGAVPQSAWPGVPLSGLPDLVVEVGRERRRQAWMLADWRWQWPEP